MKTILSLTLLLAVVVGMTGCGVIGGAGQDISSVGHVVTKSANSVKHNMPY
jgi:predicted small secreted protein